MSQAEYAPKPLPVLTRLAIALRRIPAVEFAFAKFKSLLRGRANDEPADVSEFQAPAEDVTKDDVARRAVEAETAQPDTVQAAPDGTEAAAARPVETDTVEAEEIKAPATDVAETATTETGAAAIGADEPVTTNVCDVTSPAMASDDLSGREIETVASGDLPVEVEIAEIEAAQTPLAAIESDEADSVETEDVETVARNADDVTAHVAPPEDSSEAVAAESDVLPLASAETGMIEVDAIETVPSEIKTGSEAAQPDAVGPDAIEPEAVGTAPALIETFETGGVDPDVAETLAATAVETDVEQLDLVAADTVETAPVEVISAKVDIAPAAITKPDDLCDRETLIRRRWKETGIRMWHGAGQSVLCIQGRIALLPPKPGESMPGYDRLEFRLIDGLITCEGFVVDPPEPPRFSQFA
ncbi:hypothetical protein [Bradyrhizobium iriomotense]|uniref:Uncharacterized protein n=1 Tax=Bradyrhizobium iriomotense TaxID=441950 RepID=A0ABQ6AU80_9BRAD|nr:hypothetical protein [Bradyrhizobium iriomotense]GLR84529.1 hypothetical protein GCM10007857_12390 [Bradyrhizobium iriomotense]